MPAIDFLQEKTSFLQALKGHFCGYSQKKHEMSESEDVITWSSWR